MNNYTLPKIELLKDIDFLVDDKLNEYVDKIEKILNDFKVPGEVVYSYAGPISLQFEIKLKPGIKVEKLMDLKPEFKFYLGSKFVELEGPRDNKSTIGIKMPNPNKYDVHIKDVLKEEYDKLLKMNIPVVLGKKDSGENIVFDLSKIQHLLVGGITGSGKSTFLNSLINSILFTKSPDEVKLAITDTKGIDFVSYNSIPHLIWPVVSDRKQAVLLLNRLADEMKRRYQLFNDMSGKTVKGYNEFVERWNERHPNDKKQKLPFIVVVVDWLDEMMIFERRETTKALYQLIRNGDEAGIHLVISTQRPDYNILPGEIRDNINSRMCFMVRSADDSNIVLDENGAEQITGVGECIFKPLYGEKVHAKVAYLTDSEQFRIVDDIKNNNAQYKSAPIFDECSEENETVDESLYDEAVDIVLKDQKVSAAFLQRKLRIGYNTAIILLDKMEEDGIIGPATGTSTPRKILMAYADQVCPNCGNVVQDGYKFCTKCGNRIR